MTEQPASSMPDRVLNGIGRALEGALFNSRWLMAPFLPSEIASSYALLPIPPTGSPTLRNSFAA
jgi:hypothetical protein